MRTFYESGTLEIPIACDRGESEFSDESGRILPGIMAYTPSLGDEFWTHRLTIVIDVSLKSNHAWPSDPDSVFDAEYTAGLVGETSERSENLRNRNIRSRLPDAGRDVSR